MPDLQSAIFSRLTADASVSALVGTKIYPVIVPADKVPPYVRHQIVSDPRPEHLGGYNAARQTRVQFDCFAKTSSAARALAESIISAMAQPATVAGVKFGRSKAEGPRDLGEDTSSGFVHRAALDLLIEHSLA